MLSLSVDPTEGTLAEVLELTIIYYANEQSQMREMSELKVLSQTSADFQMCFHLPLMLKEHPACEK